jgi:hypothetical protein
MVLYHIYRMYVSYLSGIFDIGRTQMVITMKLTSFAYNFYDGVIDVPTGNLGTKAAKIILDRRKYAVAELPSILEFAGYVFSFPGLLVGPAFEYAEYISAFDNIVLSTDDAIPSPSRTSGVGLRPSSIVPGLTCFCKSIIMMVGYVIVSAKFPVKYLYDPVWIQQQPTYFHQFTFLMVAVFGERLKFYFVWKIAEAACILGGFGFQGYNQADGIVGWSGVENVDIRNVEFATSLQMLSRAWNKRTQSWLERYTYNRSNGNVVLLYFVSALWHGLYPAYFVCFMTVPLLTAIERLAKSRLTPYVLGTNTNSPIRTSLYAFACWSATLSSLTYVFQVGVDIRTVIKLV